MTTPARSYRDLTGSVPVTVPAQVLALDPVRPADGTRPPVLLGLHGYAMNAAAMLPLLRRMVPDESWMIVALQGPHTTLVPGTEESPDRRLGFHWGVSPRPEESRAAHRAAVIGALDFVDAHGGDLDRVSLVGFSQPCSFNYRLALAPPTRRPFRAVVGTCGGIPGDWLSAPFDGVREPGTAALHVSTAEDPFYPLERIRVYGEKLAERFGAVEHRTYDGGHRIPSAAFGDVQAFLRSHG